MKIFWRNIKQSSPNLEESGISAYNNWRFLFTSAIHILTFVFDQVEPYFSENSRPLRVIVYKYDKTQRTSFRRLPHELT